MFDPPPETSEDEMGLLSCAEIGRKLGLSKQRVHAISLLALRKIRLGILADPVFVEIVKEMFGRIR